MVIGFIMVITPEDAKTVISEWYRHLGRKGGAKGGASRSETKRKATRKNAAKARKAKALKRLKGQL